MKVIYNLFITLYPKIAWLISGKNAKAKLWLQGRKNIFESLKIAFKNNTDKVVWVHCSSLGEFEQGRPIIENLKKQFPFVKILLTFFSPSGFEVRKNYEGADWIFYLPMDSPQNAKRFFSIVQPALILFVKYEFWYYYLAEAKLKNVPLILISGIFRSNQIFFKWYGNFYREMLQCFTHLFVQNEASQILLSNIHILKNVSVTGDTRFDRVLKIVEQFEPITAIEKFVGNNTVIVAGSTWTEDDEELAHYANTHTEIKFIIAPHEIEEERLQECLTLYKHSILFSDWSQQTNPDNGNINCLIIDNIGMLSKLYYYATICYVGGGFGSDGVHNVLEAAVYNKPVFFGCEYEKYIEATEIIEAGGAVSIDNALALEKELTILFTNEKLYQEVANSAGNYVQSKAGATKKIIQFVQEKRLLIN